MANYIKMSEWQQCGAMICVQNSTAETTVDATFRKIEAFNLASGVHGLIVDLDANTISVPVGGTYQFVGTSKFEGSNKIFELQLYINDEPSGIIASDKGSGDAAIGAMVELKAGDVIDARQRSTDGGTTLTVETMTLSLHRLI